MEKKIPIFFIKNYFKYFFEIDVVHVWKATKIKIDLLKGAI
jgi:hypothetical protein